MPSGLVYKLTNFAETTLGQELTLSSTSMVVASSAKFPVLSSGEAFRVTLLDGVQDPEVIEITAIAGETWTVGRGMEGTAARTWPAGAKVRLAPTAEILSLLAATPAGGITYFPRDVTGDITVASGRGAFGVGTRFAGNVTVESDGILVLSPDSSVAGTLTVAAGGKVVNLSGVDSTGTVAFADGDTTPDVSIGRLFVANNSSPTTIVDFDGGKEGQHIDVVFSNSNTTVDFSASNIVGNGGADWNPGPDSYMTCFRNSAGKWFCNVIADVALRNDLRDGKADVSDYQKQTFATYLSATTFSVTDATDFHVGRRIKTSEGAYGVITDVSGTTITVELSSGALTAALALVQLGPAADVTSAAVQYYPLKSGEVGVVNYQYEYGDVRRYGAVGDGVTDDTVAIQNCIDSMQAFVTASPNRQTGPEIRFPDGDFVFTELTLKTCPLVGAGPTTGTRLLWTGTDGVGVALTVPFGYPGGASHGGIFGIEFRAKSPAAQPENWLVIDTLVDKQYQLSRVRFTYSRGDAIKVNAGWINLHWDNLRFDYIDGYMITATTLSTQNLSSFIIDKFTYDYVLTAGNSNGMIHIDNTADATELGIVEISNGRIEINQAWTGNQAIVTYTIPNTPTAVRSMDLVLKNITYADAAGMVSDCVLYRNTTNTTGRESLTLINFRPANLSAILGGTWPSNQYLPEGTVKSYLALNTTSDHSVIDLSSGVFGRNISALAYLIQLAVGTDTESRYRVRADGLTEWGGGAGATDVNLYRSGIGKLKTDNKLMAGGGIGVGNYAANTNTPLGATANDIEVFDEFGNSIGFIPVYGARW